MKLIKITKKNSKEKKDGKSKGKKENKSKTKKTKKGKSRDKNIENLIKEGNDSNTIMITQKLDGNMFVKNKNRKRDRKNDSRKY